MTRERLFSLHQEMTAKAFEILKAKNKDYSPDEDPFSNIRLCERMGVASADVGVLVRMCDKFQRFCNLVKRNGEAAVKDESVVDTGLDFINYIIIELGLMSEKSNGK